MVIPAYNEEDRLSKTMKENVEYFEKAFKEGRFNAVEIIVVDDGSKDTTFEVAMEWSRKVSEMPISDKLCVRVVQMSVNSGKGGAVKTGVCSSRGEYILFADADGATDINDLSKVHDEMLKVVGSNE